MPKMIGLINDDKSAINKKFLESELNNKVPITRKVNGQSLDKDIEIIGARGTGILKVTTAPTSYTTAIGEYTPKYRIALSTVTSQSGVSEVLLGDVIQYSYYQYLVDYLDSTYAYISATRTSLQGAPGLVWCGEWNNNGEYQKNEAVYYNGSSFIAVSDGDAIPSGLEPGTDDTSWQMLASKGSDGASITVKSVSTSSADGGSNVVTFSDGKTITIKNGKKGSDGKNGVDGKTPVKGTDYFDPTDKAEMVAAVIAALPVYAGEVV